MNIHQKIQALIAANDQDRAMMDDWLDQASDEAILRVWNAIQQPYEDPAMEIMSRFAQLALGEALAARVNPKDDEVP